MGRREDSANGLLLLVELTKGGGGDRHGAEKAGNSPSARCINPRGFLMGVSKVHVIKKAPLPKKESHTM